MINKVTLVGNLGKDPEVRKLESGASVAKFSVATNENYKDKNGEWQTVTEWHNVVAWRALADRAERDLKKGTLVYVEGKLTTRKWQDKDGGDRYSTEIVAFVLRSLEKRESSNDAIGGSFPSASDEFQKADNQTIKSSSTNDAAQMEDDDLPF
jgi:single-strand DNA-binding protein